MPASLVVATTNYQTIVRPLQWFVVILIFLFFLRVIRAVWVETSPGGRRRKRADRQGGRSGTGLVIIEPTERVDERYDVVEGVGVTVGRSATCDVVVAEDVYASTVHARILREDSGLWVEDLASTNGTYVNADRIETRTKLTRGDVLQVGGTVFEVIR
jgi:pSer/pThr/pTyr-binding forkhead associated (FHA) protein